MTRAARPAPRISFPFRRTEGAAPLGTASLGTRYAPVVPGPTEAVLVFDGDCGFCSAAAEWIAARWKSPRTADVVPWQRLGEEGLHRLGLTRSDVTRAAWWVAGDKRSGGHLAVARALVAAGGGWGAVGRLMLVPPVRWAGAICYRLVAHYRYRLPGGSPACRT